MSITVAQWRRTEISLKSTKQYKNPFLDLQIDAVFTHKDGTKISIPGFWNGENEWKVRFCPEKPGEWAYLITCTDTTNPDLHNISGSITATPSKNATPLEQKGFAKLETGKRTFVYGDGSAFYWLGDTHWQMPDYERINECNYPNCSCGNQFKHLVDDRISKGFNVYQTYFDSAQTDGGGQARRYNWWSRKYTIIDPKPFNEHVDKMFEYLADNGVTIAMGFGVHSSSTLMGEEALMAFSRYCVARYACYPVIWITGQEITCDLATTQVSYSMWCNVSNMVSHIDGYKRPLGAHMYPHYYEAAAPLDKLPWHEWWTLQAGHGNIPSMQKQALYKSFWDNSNKPFIETESQYEDIYCGRFNGYDAPRMSAWKANQCGSCGFTYGVTGVWAMRYDESEHSGWLGYSPEPWYIGMEKPGSAEVGYMKKFYEYVGFSQLVPRFNSTDYCLFEEPETSIISTFENKTYVVYFYNPSKETGALLGLDKTAAYSSRWFNPRSGKFIDINKAFTAKDGKYAIPQKPNGHDWTLLVTSIALGAYETEEMLIPQTLLDKNATLGNKLTPKAFSASSRHPEHPIALAFDGEKNTYWKGFADKTSQSIKIDLGKAEELGAISILFEQSEERTYQYRMEASNDDKNYKFLLDRTFDGITLSEEYKILEKLNGKYRYVRVFFNSSDKSSPCINDISIFQSI